MKSTELFCKALLEELNNDESKKIILMSGASSSGNSHTALELKKFFIQQGKNPAIISADNYYKGMARIIVEKAIAKDGFNEFADKCDEIVKLVRSVIEESDFNDKFSEANCRQLLSVLSPIFEDRTAEFVNAIRIQKNNINFDEPFAVDFNSLVRDINILSEGGKINLPNYSFQTSETTFDGAVIDANQTDVFLIEGIYALRDEVLDSIDYDSAIKCGINCDTKTLMSRRFSRDIGGGRSTFSPGQTIMTFITKVMPAYYRYTKPTLMYADYVLDTSLTSQEISAKVHNTQAKFAVSDMDEYVKKYGAKLLSSKEEVDYFLADENAHSDITLRLRVKDNLASNLSFKVGKGILNRSLDDYDLVSALTRDERDVKNFVTALKNSGFKISDMLRKQRMQYSLNGVVFRVDRIEGLGDFFEIDYNQFEGLSKSEINEKMNQLKVLFRLGEPITTSYINLQKDKVAGRIPVESERKYKLELGQEELKTLTNKKPKKNIRQFYLELYDKEVQSLLIDSFGRNIQFKDFGEARIRFVGRDRAYLTMKSRGKAHRLELEKEIPVFNAEEYIQYSWGDISKTRYVIHRDEERDLTFELDVYKNKPLVLLEVEYDPDRENVESVGQCVAEFLSKYNIKYQDVTSDRNYKNKNLAQEI